MPSARGDAAEFALQEFLPYRLAVLSARVSGQIARVYARRFQLTIAEWRTMAILGGFGPMTANAVAERGGMDKVRVSRAVARLLEAGRIARHVDEADRRRAVLHLTPEGAALYREIVPLALSAEARLLQPLSAKERADLARLMARLEACAAADFAAT
jgi:DNA-binding MarR family transcriptional regulator